LCLTGATIFRVKDLRLITNTLYLVRHGENHANLTKELSSLKVDYPLTPKGRLQAQQTAEYFQDKAIHAIYASPMKRAAETAHIIAAALRLEAVLMENFRELQVGDLEDLGNSPEAWRRHDEVIGAWKRGDLGRNFPGGENCLTVLQRMRQGLEIALDGRSGQNVIVVAHGGLFNTSVQDVCPGVDIAAIWASDFANCAISEIRMARKNGRWAGSLLRWADFSHLHSQAAELVSGWPGK
jgi:probable phosphoglycerate mutase